MKKKVMFSGIILLIMLFAVMQFVFASDSWTDARTYSLDNKDDVYKTITTTGNKLGQNKTSDSTSFQEYTVTRSMWSKPEFKLVNSNNETRSNSVNTADNGQYVTGGGNVGTVGYALYGAVKPDWSQTSPGTIKLQMKVF